MIIEIALGIVLAVVILVFLPAILRLALWALGAVAWLGAVVGLFYLPKLAREEPIVGQVMGIAIAILVAFGVLAVFWDWVRAPGDIAAKLKALWHGMKALCIEAIPGFGALLLVILPLPLIAAFVPEHLAVPAICGSYLFVVLPILFWIRAREKKTPSGSP